MPLVDVIAKVLGFAGRGDVTSPVSGARGVLVHLEMLEDDKSLGVTVIGDAIELVADDGARYVVLGRRATFGFVNVRNATALESAPAELVPLLVRARGTGRLSVREYVVREGDRLRLRCHVDAGLVVRDDVGPVLLDETV